MDKKNHIIGFFMGGATLGLSWCLLSLFEQNIFISIFVSIVSYTVGHAMGLYIFAIKALKKPLLAILTILCVFISSYFVKPINEKRQSFSPSQEEFLTAAPPEIVIATTALGGLRGIIIDILWLRAEKLRAEGKHYEIIQLYNFIGKLEPRIPSIWEFTAWEMSYNLAANAPDEEEKWRWLWKGIEQLRDYGIRYNPSHYKLYQQLAFIFIHKIGIDADDLYNRFYQVKLIELVNKTISSRQNMEDLLDVPKNYNALVQHPDMQPLIAKISASGLQKLAFSEEIKNLNKEEETYYSEALKENPKSFELLEKYWTVKKLWENLRMTPQEMHRIEKKYIKLDWRLPASHSLYWAQQGVDVINTKSEEWKKDDVHKTHVQNMNRSLFFALREIFEYGKPISINENGLVCIPNFDVVEPLHKVFLDLKEVWGKREIVSHEEFLRSVVKTSYVYGRKDIALKYYRELGKNFPNPNYKKNIQEYVITEIARKIRTMGRKHELETYTVGILINGYTDLFINFSSTDGTKRAFEFEQFSMLIHQEYVRRHGSLENIHKFQKPKPYKDFVETALKTIKQNFLNSVGEEKGQQIWNTLRSQYPGTIIIE